MKIPLRFDDPDKWHWFKCLECDVEWRANPKDNTCWSCGLPAQKTIKLSVPNKKLP